MERWQELCSEAIDALMARKLGRTELLRRDLGVPNDETLLMAAIATTPGVTIEMLPIEHAGAAVGTVPDALISHDSAHDKAQVATRAWGSMKKIRRRVVETFVGQPYAEWMYGAPSKWLRTDWR
jgi:hypothetical protein